MVPKAQVFGVAILSLVAVLLYTFLQPEVSIVFAKYLIYCLQKYVDDGSEVMSVYSAQRELSIIDSEVVHRKFWHATFDSTEIFSISRIKSYLKIYNNLCILAAYTFSSQKYFFFSKESGDLTILLLKVLLKVT